MSARFIEIAPGEVKHPDMIGFYPLPFNARIETSGDRIQAIANATGLPLLVSDVLEQGRKMIFDMKARDANRPGPNFESASKRRAEEFLKHTADLADFKRIGIGHSLGSVIISAMQLYGEKKPFDAIELSDGFNLRNIGYSGYIGYKLRDFAQAKSRERRSPEPVPPQGNWTVPQNDQHETSFFEKMRNVSDLMRSDESVSGALALAGEPDLPLHVIGFQHGLSGSTRYLQPFMDQLRERRASAQTNTGRTAAPLELSELDYWHSDLLRQSVVVSNLQVTLKMVATA